MKKTVLTVTAICLAAVLLCGSLCLGTAHYVKDQTARQAELAAKAQAAAIPAVSLSSTEGGALAATEIYKLACSQVVGISTQVSSTNAFGQVVTGTGFVLTSDGYILTNNHVISDAYAGDLEVIVMLHDGSEYPAEIVGVEADNDIAVLKIEASGLSPVSFGSSSTMLVGEAVYVVGNPLGELTYTMTSGIVSALDREISAEQGRSVNMFQLDAAVNSGNSGGPVYNDRGQVVGVVTAKYKASGVEGLSFAVPADDAGRIAREIMEHGYVTGKPSFGITVTTMSPQYAEYYGSVTGAYVHSVNPGSCAEAAGILQGDVITRLGDMEVRDIEDLNKAKKAFRAGDKASVTVYRSGEYLELTVIFDEALPEAPGSAVTPSPAPRPETPDADMELRPGGEAGGFSDFFKDFFDSFYDYFGQQQEEEEDDRGFRHFGS